MSTATPDKRFWLLTYNYCKDVLTKREPFRKEVSRNRSSASGLVPVRAVGLGLLCASVLTRELSCLTALAVTEPHPNPCKSRSQ
jgi:hypothetical protein